MFQRLPKLEKKIQSLHKGVEKIQRFPKSLNLLTTQYSRRQPKGTSSSLPHLLAPIRICYLNLTKTSVAYFTLLFCIVKRMFLH
uniref:Ankyrin repeat-containing protein At3g12360-like isoform X1 n=1 Tax=Rhizophora mucronata TaxID=61149 RepID=A0A2P2MNT2_RHIMU